MDPRNGGDILCWQEGVHPVPRVGRREGGAGHGCCPVEVGGGDPQDPLRVPAGRDDEEEQRIASNFARNGPLPQCVRRVLFSKLCSMHFEKSRTHEYSAFPA